MREAQFTTLITCPAYLDCRPDDRIEVSGYCARSSTDPRRYRSLRGWGTTVLDDDLRLLQSVATFPKQRVRFASTHASAEADGRTRLARGASEAHGDRV